MHALHRGSRDCRALPQRLAIRFPPAYAKTADISPDRLQ
jgi:hypothetical protein